MPATAVRPELFVYLATQPMRHGKRGWPAFGNEGSRAKDSLLQALRDVLGQPAPSGGPEAPVLYADALASALVGAIPNGRWTLKPKGGTSPIVGKF